MEYRNPEQDGFNTATNLDVDMDTQNEPTMVEQGAAEAAVAGFDLEDDAKQEFTANKNIYDQAIDFLADYPFLTQKQKSDFIGLAFSFGLEEAKRRLPQGFLDPPPLGARPRTNPENDPMEELMGAMQQLNVTPEITPTPKIEAKPNPKPNPRPNPNQSNMTFLPALSSTKAAFNASQYMGNVDLTPILDVVKNLDERAKYLENKISTLSVLSSGHAISIMTPSFESSHMLVPSPALGSVDLVSASILKSLMACVGSEKYSVGNPSSKPLRHFLPMVATTIEQHKLSEKAAYTVLLHILTGDVYTTVFNFQHIGKSFDETWRHIQLCGQASYSKEQIEKEIKKLVVTKPASLNNTLTKLHALYFDLYRYIESPTRRSDLINQRFREDIFRIIDRFYPECYSAIETEYERISHLSQENLLGERKFDEVGTLIEITVSYISRRQISLDRQSLSVSALEVQPDIQEQKVVAPPVPSSDVSAISIANALMHAFNSGGNQGGKPGFNSNRSQGSSQPSNQSQAASRSNTNNYQGSNQSQNMGERKPFRYEVDSGCCFKCNRPNHFAKDCKTYPNERSCPRQCKFCGGYHSSNCKRRPQANFSQNQSNQQRQPQQQQQRGNDRRGHVVQGQYVPSGGLANAGRQNTPQNVFMNTAHTQEQN